MRSSLLNHTRFLKSRVDIDPEEMSKATLVYLKERPVDNESQSHQSNPQSHSSTEAVAADQKRADPIALHPSKEISSLSSDPDAGYPEYPNSLTEDQRRGGTVGSPPDLTMRVSEKPNANSSIRGKAFNEAWYVFPFS